MGKENVRLGWNGLKITRNQEYSGSEIGVTDEATLGAWMSKENAMLLLRLHFDYV